MKTAKEWCAGGWCTEENEIDVMLKWVEDIQRDALSAAAAICRRSEDECTKDPMCHAHDAVEIEALKPEGEKA